MENCKNKQPTERLHDFREISHGPKTNSIPRTALHWTFAVLQIQRLVCCLLTIKIRVDFSISCDGNCAENCHLSLLKREEERDYGLKMQRRMSITIREYKFFRSFSQKFENWPKRKAEALWRKMRERKIAGNTNTVTYLCINKRNNCCIS